MPFASKIQRYYNMGDTFGANDDNVTMRLTYDEKSNGAAFNFVQSKLKCPRIDKSIEYTN